MHYPTARLVYFLIDESIVSIGALAYTMGLHEREVRELLDTGWTLAQIEEQKRRARKQCGRVAR